jgi:hypothetical protein
MANNGRMNESGQFVRSDGSVCYNLPGAGDYYASLGYHVVPGQDNVHYTITPQGTFWTTAPLTDASPLQIVTEKVENAKETLSEMAEPVLDGAAGFVTRIDDNVSFGIVQNGYEEITGHRIDDRDTLAFYKGQVAGDILSGGVGVGEIAAGSAGGSLSIAAIPESGGLSIVAVDASYGTIALGTNTLNNAKQNLQQDWLKATTRESEGSSNAKTTAELIKDVTIKDGKYYSPKATIDEIGQLEAKGVDFSKLDSKVMSSRPSTEGGTSRVVKYSDSDGTKFIVHEVTDQSGNVLHRDFDAVRIESGQLINKAEK